MQYRQLGRSVLSALCAWHHELWLARQRIFWILSSAAEAGINFIDTADQYGGDAV